MRRTRSARIVATLGPSTTEESAIRALFERGVDVFRLNFSHGTQHDHARRLETIRRLEKEFDRPIGILLDLQGPKLRLGSFEGGRAQLDAGARNYSQCDSLLLGDQCGAHTFPYIEVKNPSARVEHEASTSRIGEDQLFYCQQRGISVEDAVSMIVNGFCKEVFKELPMEFAVEAQKLMSVSLEGTVG